MQKVEAASAEVHCFGFGIAPRPTADVDVSPDGGDGRYSAKPLQNLRRADITGVEDMGHPRKTALSLRSEKAVRIRDHSDPQRHVRPSLQCRTSSGTFPISSPSWFVTRMEK